MLRPRVSPCLLLRSGGLVKTRKFKDEKYVGDPINAVKIFNEKSVDELIVIDIDATRYNREPDYNLARLANESRMPLCYAGGIKSVGQAERIVQLGVEKVGLSSSAINNPSILTEMSKSLGRQSVVGVLDLKKTFLQSYDIYVKNGTIKVKGSLERWVEIFQNNGVGEILFNSIDRDGMQVGYDVNLASMIVPSLNVPSTFLGGAASLGDVAGLVEKVGVVGCAAGSMFVFKGKYRAVLINYPEFNEKYSALKTSLEKHRKQI